MKIARWFQKLLVKLGFCNSIINYIGNGETLPEPYTYEEENEMVARLLKGEEGVKDELIEHNLRLVIYIARRFDNTKIDMDDLISVGTIGLIKAINSFNAEKNIKLATYASRCIENEILMHLRRNVKYKNEVSFDEPLNTDWEGNELLLCDIMGTENDVVYKDMETQAETDILKKALSKLNERERVIMQLRYGLTGRNEKTQKEVADMLGISQSYISRLEKKIIFRLKKEFQKMI